MHPPTQARRPRLCIVTRAIRSSRRSEPALLSGRAHRRGQRPPVRGLSRPSGQPEDRFRAVRLVAQRASDGGRLPLTDRCGNRGPSLATTSGRALHLLSHRHPCSCAGVWLCPESVHPAPWSSAFLTRWLSVRRQRRRMTCASRRYGVAQREGSADHLIPALDVAQTGGHSDGDQRLATIDCAVPGSSPMADSAPSAPVDDVAAHWPGGEAISGSVATRVTPQFDP